MIARCFLPTVHEPLGLPDGYNQVFRDTNLHTYLHTLRPPLGHRARLPWFQATVAAGLESPSRDPPQHPHLCGMAMSAPTYTLSHSQ